MHIFDELKERGLIYQISDEEAFKKLLESKKGSFYIGFDPTATSLHLGNLLGITFAKRLQKAGLRPILLVGGATGLIGDPSGKSEERKLNSKKDVEKMAQAIKKQLDIFFDFKTKKALFVNNIDWIGKFSYLEFLRDVGKYFNVAEMLAKESVKMRLSTGISYTEFSYMLIQGYDFVYLSDKYGADLQVGGSDQWGNITTGIELLRKIKHKESIGITLPLVVDANGKKLGKSEGNAPWLDSKLISPYHFYQHLLNVDDRDVVKFLKYFTFVSLDEIVEIEKKTKTEPEKREAQKILAKELTGFVHGKEAVKIAEKISQDLFLGEIKNLSKSELEIAFESVGAVVVKKYIGKNVLDFLVEAEVVSSKRQAREDILNKSIEISGKVIDNLDYNLTKADLLFGRYIVIKKGRKNYRFVKI